MSNINERLNMAKIKISTYTQSYVQYKSGKSMYVMYWTHSTLKYIDICVTNEIVSIIRLVPAILI